MLLVLAVLAGCSLANRPRVAHLSYRSVVDTRALTGFSFDSNFTRAVLNELEKTWPVENAVCVYGKAIVDSFGPHIEFTGISPAAIAQADEYNIWTADSLKAGCAPRADLVGWLHGHTQMMPYEVCSHSDTDAKHLTYQRDWLLSIVFCDDGRGEVLWQDGRRQWFEWMRRVSLTN